jgi:RNA polymerase sigma factor (sigma-70 family)
MEGFESAYRRHFPAVLRFARSLVGRRDVAEDLTADAFVELHRHFAGIVVEELPAWLFVVVRNRARDLWRRRLVEQRHAQWLAREPVETTRPTAGPLWLSTDGLAPVQRVCLEMHYVWGYTVAEIAARLGMSEGQVKGHLQRARSRLRAAERNPRRD